MSRTIELDITGMTCASCAARIEKKLNKISGVSAAVNYATNKAHVVVEGAHTDGQLIEVVEKAGYGANLSNPKAPLTSEARQLLPRLITSATITLPVMLISMIPPLQFPGWQWLALACTTVVVFWCGLPFHKATIVNLKHRGATMDTLISLGTFAAYLWSLYAMIFGHAGQIGMKHHFNWQLTRTSGEANVYFEAACGIITFILLGRFIEARSKKQAGAALQALLEMGAKQVLLLRDDKEILSPIEALKPGDLFVVKPGEKIASDGQIVDGMSAVDNSLITGESIPVEVGPGDKVIGATINTSGRLVVAATAVGKDTELAHIAKLVEQAQTTKAEVARLADKVSGIFVPTVLAITLVTFIGWMVSGAPVAFAIPTAVAVLIIACPCALGLATPTALLAGTGRGARLGIVIRGADVLERVNKLDTIIFDKTGTLTTGRMQVTGVESFTAHSTEEILWIAGCVEQASEHPVAKAIQKSAEDRFETPLEQVTDFVNLPGLGVKGILNKKEIFAGNHRLMAENNISIPKVEQGSTTVFIAWSGKVQGMISVTDSLKPSAKPVVEALTARNLEPIMLTGDNQQVADKVAAHLGISKVYANVLPADKLNVVTSLQRKGATLAMVGDGVNDAAALTKADIGISMGAGTDVAIASADIILMNNNLNLVVDALRLSKATLATIKSNLFWAFFYNTIAIPVAALGFLNPMLAGLAMSFSSVFVVTNSLRLTRFQ